MQHEYKSPPLDGVCQKEAANSRTCAVWFGLEAHLGAAYRHTDTEPDTHTFTRTHSPMHVLAHSSGVAKERAPCLQWTARPQTGKPRY